MIRVVNVRGLRTPEQRQGTVYCGRPFAGWAGHPLANPFRVRVAEGPDAIANCLTQYRAWLLARPTLEADLTALWEETRHGELPLGCWCCAETAGDGSPVRCHAQILCEMLQERFGKE